jgi:hypothetical protein
MGNEENEDENDYEGQRIHSNEDPRLHQFRHHHHQHQISDQENLIND